MGGTKIRSRRTEYVLSHPSQLLILTVTSRVSVFQASSSEPSTLSCTRLCICTTAWQRWDRTCRSTSGGRNTSQKCNWSVILKVHVYFKMMMTSHQAALIILDAVCSRHLACRLHNRLRMSTLPKVPQLQLRRLHVLPPLPLLALLLHVIRQATAAPPCGRSGNKR